MAGQIKDWQEARVDRLEDRISAVDERLRDRIDRIERRRFKTWNRTLEILTWSLIALIWIFAMADAIAAKN